MIGSPFILKGNTQDLKMLFDEHYAPMMQIAIFLMNDPATAEDIVQEVFINLWEKRDTLGNIFNIRSYLLSSVRNRCINRISQQKVIEKYQEEYLKQTDSEHESTEEFIFHIYRLLEKLPTKRRIVLELSILDSKSYQEIAQLQNISINTVKDHIKKAYAFLRQEAPKNISKPLLILLLQQLRK